MNRALAAYRWVTWLGILVNLGFILPALSGPDTLETILGPGSVELSYVWVGAAGMTLLVATIFYIPAGVHPLRYPGYAWLAVVGRALAAMFWIGTNLRWHLPGPISTFWVTDAAFAVLLFILLQLGMPTEYKASPANLSRLAGALTPPPSSSRAALVFRLVVWTITAGHLAFAFAAFVMPAALAAWLQTTVIVFTYVWLGNVAILLVQIALFSLPAAHNPVRYYVYAWIAACGEAIACLFWLWQSARWHLSGPVRWFWVIAAVLAAVQFVTLHAALPAQSQLRLQNVARLVAGLLAAIGRAIPTLAAKAIAGVAALFLGALLYGLWANLVRAEPDTVFADPAEQFKYGAIGLGQASRIPLYVWEVLPDVCQDLLPRSSSGSAAPVGWASLGLLYEPAHELPVGFSKRVTGYTSVEPNCALCHTGSYRAASTAPQQLILGGPAHELDLQAFQWFLYDCASRPQFTPEALLAAIRARHALGWFEAAVYRYAILPFTKSGLAQQQQGYAWQKSRPPQGRGRTDTFNPTKITVFHQPDDGTIGTVDLPAIWNQRAREGMWLHWDGNNNTITERNYAAAMAIGATPYSVIDANFSRVTSYVLALPPPPYPFAVDKTLAERGLKVFGDHCASCHAFGSAKVGTVTPIGEIGTDRHRLDSFTTQLVAAFHSIAEGPFVFNAYRKTDGYANLPIDGTWARAPYLHNGSVPTLWDLLQPPEARPATFWRGGRDYDQMQLGFITPPNAPGATLFDTSLPGNAATGHTYGTTLGSEDKKALIEYLKTF
jgi:mono/diheme cytochrome c family protein